MTRPQSTKPHFAELQALQQAVDRSDHAAADEALLRLESTHGADFSLLVRAWALVSHSLYRRNELPAAARLAAKALEFAPRAHSELAQAEAHIAWARIEWAGGQLDDALMHLGEASSPDLQREHRLQTHLNNLLGLVHAELGQADVSEQYHRAALRAAHNSGHADLLIIALTNLAGRLLSRGEALAAQPADAGDPDLVWQELDSVVQQAETQALQHAQELTLPHILVSHAASLLCRGKLAQARQVLERHQSLVDRFPDRSSVPHAALVRCRLHRSSGEPALARAALLMGIAEADRLEARARQAALHLAACELEEAQGHFRDALAHHKRFHALREACAVEGAQRKSIALSLRLQTQQALRDAAEAKRRAKALAVSNDALRLQADALGEAAHRDALTGLPNRRVLDETLPMLHAHALGQRQPLCIALLDVDHFKQVNDDHSHSTGDAVFRTLGALLRRHFRGTDLCARYGGEEFVIALPGVDLEDGLRICESLRERVQEHDWSTLSPQLKMTVSLGLCEATDHPDVAQALQQADRRLYRAKRLGRNQAVAGDGNAARTAQLAS